jgi:predicted nucleotidyltransferase
LAGEGTSKDTDIEKQLSLDNNNLLLLYMRLSDLEIESIKSLANLYFGKGVQVFLFGSRTNNKLRGGDIDLFISNPNGEYLKTFTKIKFLTDLILQIGDQKIDVVLDNPEMKNTVFFKTICQTGIQLC